MLTAVLGLEPDGDALRTAPMARFTPMSVRGLRVGGRTVDLTEAG
ncbi:hypothetical protein [Agromyces bauzanensis]|nr:hypothetical protein [Agromyces bauzanensis]